MYAFQGDWDFRVEQGTRALVQSGSPASVRADTISKRALNVPRLQWGRSGHAAGIEMLGMAC
jgi:hypothetical protein